MKKENDPKKAQMKCSIAMLMDERNTLNLKIIQAWNSMKRIEMKTSISTLQR
jgi:hypothetical protein